VLAARGRRPRRRVEARPLILPAIVLTAVILAATVWALSREPPLLGIGRLPDGTELRLEAVTVGPRHCLIRGRYWQRLLAPLLPPSLRGQSGATVCTYRGGRPGAVVFWTTWDRSSPATDWDRAVAFNEGGEETEATARAFYESVPPRGEKVRGWVVPAFPRRGGKLGLRIYAHHQRDPVAEFVVPNPAPGPYPVWTASPLPATASDGPLAFALTELQCGDQAPRRLPPSYHERGWTHAAFRVSENGHPTDRWEPVRVCIMDATGNSLAPQFPWAEFRSRQHGETHLRFLGNLPRGEATWKLRAEFVPIRGFAPGELWTVRGVTIPRGHRDGQAGSTARWYGRPLHLRVRAMARPWRQGSIDVDTRMEPLVEGLRVAMVRATDDRGRSCLPSGREWIDFLPSPDEAPRPTLAIDGPFGSYFYPQYWAFGSYDELRPAADAKRVDLTYAVVRSRFVQFTVKPMWQ
jgi:hypothetical protein